MCQLCEPYPIMFPKDNVNLVDMILGVDTIPIIIEKEHIVDCCIRGYHVYQRNVWDTNIEGKLEVCHETRAAALVADKYAMALKLDGKTIGHIPMFLSKIAYFFLKNGGTLEVEINGPRQYSRDLDQGGLELPCTYRFLTSDENMHKKVVSMVDKAMEGYHLKVENNEEKKKKKKKKKDV